MTTGFESIDVIIPVCNEELGLPTFHERIRRVDLPLHLIFIDNASTDESLQTLRSFPDVTIIEHDQNEGYGGSICDGIAHSTAEAIVIIDADCEYPPEIIPRLIDALEGNDAVYASRFLDQQSLQMPLLRRVGNKVITLLFNLLFGRRLTDLYTGCKALRRSSLTEVELHRKGFEHVLELGARLARKGARIAEVPIVYEPRQRGTSKMKHLSETLKFCLLLIRYRLAA